MSIIAASFVVVAFAILAYAVRLPPKAMEVFEISRSSIAIWHDTTMLDDEKEAWFRSHSLRLIILTGNLAGGTAIALSAPFGVVFLFDLFGFPLLQGTVSTLLSWKFLVVVTAVALVIYYSGTRWTIGRFH